MLACNLITQDLEKIILSADSDGLGTELAS